MVSKKNISEVSEIRNILNIADKNPFDKRKDGTIPPTHDWSYRAARGVLSAMQYSNEKLDDGCRYALVSRLSAIIRLANNDAIKL